MRPATVCQRQGSVVMAVVAAYVVHTLLVLGIGFLDGLIPPLGVLLRSFNASVSEHQPNHETIDADAVRPREIVDLSLRVSYSHVADARTTARQWTEWPPDHREGITIPRRVNRGCTRASWDRGHY